MTQRSIEIEGARTHNLKNVSADIPQGQITVITGPSGCGKSSLAFDTLYAEGQRRFVESMSTYARQFIEKMQRPDVDQIRHLQPAIAIEQKNSVKNARSTIGTATEINDYLRLLFARAGTTICPECRLIVREDSPQSVFEELYTYYAEKRVLLLAPLNRSLEVRPEALRTELIRAGFLRVLRNVSEKAIKPKKKRVAETDRGTDIPVDSVRPWIDLEEPDDAKALAETLDQAVIHVVVDRVVLSNDDRDRVTAAIATAFQAGHGTVAVMPIDVPGAILQRFHSGYQCNHCGRNFPRPEPNLFSFNSPLGACTLCNGFGKVTDVDWDRVFPDKALTLNDQPIAPFNSNSYRGNYKFVTAQCKAARIPFDVPINEFDDHQMEILKYGPDGLGGIREFFTKLEGEKYKIQSRITVARYRGYTLCPDCKGSRLLQAGRSVYWGPENQWVKDLHQLNKPLPATGMRWPMHIGEISRMSIGRLCEALELITLDVAEQQMLGRIYTEIVARLSYLNRVGLGYLTLDRQTRTLSGGEAQRINLATALGTALTQTLYVLDEPTVGLHPRDSRKLLGILRDLRDKGNTLVVVEHDTEMILGADQLIDIGPAAGSGGGQILFSGTPHQLINLKTPTLTSRFLSRPEMASVKKSVKKKNTKKPGTEPILASPVPCITIVGARENNLRNVTAQIPLHKWVCITGVSGSGKSTLIHSILFEQFNATLRRGKNEPGQHDRIDGLQHMREMFLVDQSAIGMSARSNPVTYVKAYDAIRKLLGASREARALGLTESSFSFNAGTGRCEACEGSGVTTYDMHFLAEITLPCEACNGKRFGPRVLSVSFNGKSVDQILGMTVDDAADFFKAYPGVTKKLLPLQDVGLGYLTLGQSTATLSGGEAQRLKLAAHLSIASPANARSTMMIFDEPTTGLHLSDLATLSKVFLKLVESGYSLVIIEHNLDIIRQADWIIDIGPEAGDGGGMIVAAGPPAHIADIEASHTGQFLKELLSP